MAEIFVSDLEYLIESTIADKEITKILQAVLKKDFDDVQQEYMEYSKICSEAKIK